MDDSVLQNSDGRIEISGWQSRQSSFFRNRNGGVVCLMCSFIWLTYNFAWCLPCYDFSCFVGFNNLVSKCWQWSYYRVVIILIDQLISAMKLILFQDSWSYLTVCNCCSNYKFFLFVGNRFLKGWGWTVGHDLSVHLVLVFLLYSKL